MTSSPTFTPMVTFRLALPCLALLLAAAPAAAQTQEQVPREDLPAFLFDPSYYANRTFEKKALMDGNDVRMTFFNNGLLGGLGEVRSVWPAGSPNSYIGDVLPIVAVEFPVRLPSGRDTLLVNTVTVRGPRAGIEAEGPPGQTSIFWGFEPKPGFAADVFLDPACREANDGEALNDRPAVSTDPCTWPAFWPDEPTWTNPALGRADWNGYFGRGEFNADLETYFWIDDTRDAEPQALAASVGGSFQADSTRPDLQSLGLVMKVRGMTWSNFLAKDTQFWLYEVTNTSTTTYPRVAVGYTAGVCVGEVDGDFSACQRDLAFFDQGNRIVYAWDATGFGATGVETGYVGFALLETPGDPFNGIDDDGDGDPRFPQGQNEDGVPYVNLDEAGDPNLNQFTAADFQPRTLALGDPIIVIDYDTYERSIQYLGADPITVPTPRGQLTAQAGLTVQETQTTVQGQLDPITVTASNLVDENFNGLIDEDVNLHFERRFENLQGGIEVLPALRYANYVGFAEALVTERAPNGTVLATREATRQDSLAYGLLNPRIDEVRTDPTDVTLSDQRGLTSFYYFTPPGALRMNQDRDLWRAMTPGFFTTNNELDVIQGSGGVDGNFIFGSGYFPMPPGRTLFFSLAFVFGEDLEAIRFNTETMQEIYNRNYQFTQPPIRPTLSAVPGDGRVTLYWDSASLDSSDPVLGDEAFEGYRIYKSTDPFFQDAEYVTDARGRRAFPAPEWQYDLVNGISGVYTSSDPRTRGVPFYLGDETGLRFSLVDTLVNNGQRYYYAITAYNAGSPDFYPAENNFAISVTPDGSVVTGANVVEVIPNAGVAGYQAATLDGPIDRLSGDADGTVVVEVLDSRMVPENASYTLRFHGPDPVQADSFRVFNAVGDTLAAGRIDRSEGFVFDGLRLRLGNVQTALVGRGSFIEGGEDTRPIEAVRAAFSQVGWNMQSPLVPYDYEITFSDDFTGESLGGFRIGSGNNAPNAISRPVNFTVRNTTLDRPAPFVLYEGRFGGNGRFEQGEIIFIYEDLTGTYDGTNPQVLTPVLLVRYGGGQLPGGPAGSGDVFAVETIKPFSARDSYRFGARPQDVSEEAAAQLDRIRVVPNPYVAAASWERPLPSGITGRGERRIDFIRLPADATVRVYNVRGHLIWEGRHAGTISDGTLSWDLRSREGLDVAYGVYFYHVSSPVGDRTGKLALIK